MKYIMFECLRKKRGKDPAITRRVPIIFPEPLVHAHVAKLMEPHLRYMGFDTVKAVSAGDFDVLTGKVSGKSDTLKLHHDPKDNDTITTYDYTHGMV